MIIKDLTKKLIGSILLTSTVFGNTQGYGEEFLKQRVAKTDEANRIGIETKELGSLLDVSDYEIKPIPKSGRIRIIQEGEGKIKTQTETYIVKPEDSVITQFDLNMMNAIVAHGNFEFPLLHGIVDKRRGIMVYSQGVNFAPPSGNGLVDNFEEFKNFIEKTGRFYNPGGFTKEGNFVYRIDQNAFEKLARSKGAGEDFIDRMNCGVGDFVLDKFSQYANRNLDSYGHCNCKARGLVSFYGSSGCIEVIGNEEKVQNLSAGKRR
jgi:hypothetical protein